jgi:hypothetical protein
MARAASWLGILSVPLLFACGGTDTPDEVETGTVHIRFKVTNTVRASRNLDAELVGNIYGSLFYAEEVTITGPIDGAADLGVDIELAAVDLRMDDTSTDSWISPELEPRDYIFLGFYDVDGNGATSKDPDSGDPVTLPTNAFTVEAGKKTPHVVPFDLVYN